MSPLAAADRARAGPAPFERLRPLDLAALKARVPLDARTLADAGTPPGWPRLIGALRGDRFRQPVLTRSLAWGLERLEVIWWACLSARLEEILSDRASPSQALVLAERWLREKDESVRYEAYRRAQGEERQDAANLVAMAVFLAGPSIAPKNMPPEPPQPRLASSLAESALLVAAAAPALTDTGYGFELVNMIGLQIAQGGDGREAARRALATAQTALKTTS